MENGEVREPEVVTDALRELWERGGFKAKRVYMGVGNQRVVVREIALPYLPEKELGLRSASRSRSSSRCPSTRPCWTTTRSGNSNRTTARCCACWVAAQRQMVDMAVSAVTGAKLEPVGLDLVPFAMVRSVGTTGVGMDLEDEGDEAVIDIGAHVTNIVVHARHGAVRAHPPVGRARRDPRDRPRHRCRGRRGRTPEEG